MAINDPIYSHTLSPNNSRTEFQHMNISSVKKQSHTVLSKIVPFFNFVCNIITFIILSSIAITILSIFKDALMIMDSGKTALNDLNLIIPEIKNTLNMLTKLCNHPNFKFYCGISNHTKMFYKPVM